MTCVRRDPKDYLIPIPCFGQGHPSIEQAAQGPIQPGDFITHSSRPMYK